MNRMLNIGDPCFSPDGKKIAFYYQKDKTDKTSHEELFLMNDDGTGITQLTHYPENNPSAKEYGYRAGATKWHPTEKFHQLRVIFKTADIAFLR
jgi:TolB protein